MKGAGWTAFQLRGGQTFYQKGHNEFDELKHWPKSMKDCYKIM